MFMADKSICFSKKRILICLLFAVCVAAVPALSFQMQEFSLREKQRFLFIPPAAYLEALRVNFRSFLADTYYIHGILAITDTFATYAEKVDWVQQYCRAAVVLDPKLIQAFFFGGMVIANDTESTRKGIAFLEEGLRLVPGRWEIPYWLGFNRYTLGEYLEAAQLYQSAALLPGAPNFLRSNQPMFYYKAGRAQMGLAYLEGLLETIKDPQQLEWIQVKITWLKGIIALEEAVRQFQAGQGRLPENLEELVEKKVLKAMPQDPFGGGYYFDKSSGRIKSRFDFHKSPA